MRTKLDPEVEWKKKTAGCKKLFHELPLELERVIGTGVNSNHSMALNLNTTEIAYPVGSIICIYKPKENRQVDFLHNPNNKEIN